MKPFVDRLHHKNHTNCSTGFDIDQYKFLKDVNTQAAEQNNSDLDELTAQSAFMTYENFLLYARMWKIEMNKEKNEMMAKKRETDATWRTTQRNYLDGCAQMACFEAQSN